jgi:hypothetical protein
MAVRLSALRTGHIMSIFPPRAYSYVSWSKRILIKVGIRSYTKNDEEYLSVIHVCLYSHSFTYNSSRYLTGIFITRAKNFYVLHMTTPIVHWTSLLRGQHSCFIFWSSRVRTLYEYRFLWEHLLGWCLEIGHEPFLPDPFESFTQSFHNLMLQYKQPR